MYTLENTESATHLKITNNRHLGSSGFNFYNLDGGLVKVINEIGKWSQSIHSTKSLLHMDLIQLERPENETKEYHMKAGYTKGYTRGNTGRATHAIFFYGEILFYDLSCSPHMALHATGGIRVWSKSLNKLDMVLSNETLTELSYKEGL